MSKMVGGHTTVVDLTHTLSEDMPTFDKPPIFQTRTLSDIDQGYYIREFTCNEHAGTHIDAPCHFCKDGATVDQIPLDRLVNVPAVVIDVRDKVLATDDYLITAEDIQTFEAAHGPLPDRVLVLVWTGWDVRWSDADRYRNADSDGVLHFPGFSPACVQWLLTHRPSFVGIGIDTLSIDRGSCLSYDTHHILLGADRYGLENVANLGQLPSAGAIVTVAPTKLHQGSGAPVRLFASFPSMRPSSSSSSNDS